MRCHGVVRARVKGEEFATGDASQRAQTTTVAGMLAHGAR